MKPAGSDPAFIEAAYDAKSKHHDLIVIELPLVLQPEGSSSLARPAQETESFLFRLLNFGEFDSFSKLVQFGDITDLVLKACLIYPTDPWDQNKIQFVETGFFEEAAMMLIEASGFESKDGMFGHLGEGRMLSSSIYGAAQMYICKAFPSISPRDIYNMSMAEMFKYIAMSEQMLTTDGRPVEFPLREFFKPAKRPETGHVPKDFSKLPVLTEQQVASMRTAGTTERPVQPTLEDRAIRRTEARRKKMDELAVNRNQESRTEPIVREFKR